MIAALAEAGAVLGRDDHLDAARRCAEFVWTQMRSGDGRLRRSWKDGEARLGAYLEDYAYLVEALLTLYEATFEVRWFDAARQTADLMIELFADSEHGGFFTTAHDHERLIARRKDVDDHPIPSGNSSAAYGLLRLAALTGEREYERHAVGVFRLLHRAAARHPHGLAHLLRAMDFHFASVKEVALVAPAAGATPRRPMAPPTPSPTWPPWSARASGPTWCSPAGAEGTERPELMRERSAVDGQTGRLRLRELRLPAAGHGARGARGGAGLSAADRRGAARPRGVDAVGSHRGGRSMAHEFKRGDRVEWNFRGRRGGRHGAKEAHLPHGHQRPRGRRVEGRSPLSGQKREEREGDHTQGGGPCGNVLSRAAAA